MQPRRSKLSPVNTEASKYERFKPSGSIKNVVPLDQTREEKDFYAKQ